MLLQDKTSDYWNPDCLFGRTNHHISPDHWSPPEISGKNSQFITVSPRNLYNVEHPFLMLHQSVISLLWRCCVTPYVSHFKHDYDLQVLSTNVLSPISQGALFFILFFFFWWLSFLRSSQEYLILGANRDELRTPRCLIGNLWCLMSIWLMSKNCGPLNDGSQCHSWNMDGVSAGWYPDAY